MSRSWVIVIAAVCLVLGGIGTAAAGPNEQYCAYEAGCHGTDRDSKVADLAASAHKNLGILLGTDTQCENCHENAARNGNHMSVKTTVHFDLERCGTCHQEQYLTYTYGDDFKTKYGGSPLAWPKTADFANYNDIIDGHGFAKEYNEERGHNVMLLDHADVKRGKFETCLQCKSTKVTYYWDAKNADGSRKELVVENDTPVVMKHLAGTPIYTVPKGTRVTMSTTRAAGEKHEARVLVTLPNGTAYSSYVPAGSATQNFNWTWAALYALTVNELAVDSPTRDSGNGCNHCHNAHKVGRDGTGGLLGFRLIRKSQIVAIESKGLNPYNPASPRGVGAADLENAPLTIDGGIALCGQCHVEYVCGKSGVDNIDRDFFPWAKVSDLEAIYQTEFYDFANKYSMDWKHGAGALGSPLSPGNGITYNTPFPIGEALIKSQHPEAETYWNSRHYFNDAACYTCHMPKVTKKSGGTYTSHWIASPIKYMETGSVGPFATNFGLTVDKSGIISPCGACHGGLLSRMKTKAISKQDSTYASALTVETALVASLKAIKDAKAAVGDPTLIAAAVEDHRAAHVRWENLVVSENSMGFHNPTEIDGELTNALALAQSAKQKADSSVGAPPPPPLCSSHLTKTACQAAGCTWDRKALVCK